MRNIRLLTIAAVMAALGLSGAAAAQGRASTPTPLTIAYGPDARQQMDVYRAEAAGKAPLVVFVHGGAWQIGDKQYGVGVKPAFFTGEGYAFASVNYRLVPDVTVTEQAADVAAAIARLRRDAGRLGIDPSRIALMGHSAGAHLAALIATNPRYLADAGVPLSAIRAVSLLDGSAYDVVRQIDSVGPFARRIFLRAFGPDPVEQRRVSPFLHAAAPNGGAFLIHCVARSPQACPQAHDFATALGRAGTKASVSPIDGTTHRRINLEIGAPGDQATEEIAAFLGERMR